eukprot:Hpha_TRINITY_DN26797_c0_g1::TRINITY_DN26797_c0_g1_i1::g.138993::m.138993
MVVTIPTAALPQQVVVTIPWTAIAVFTCVALPTFLWFVVPWAWDKWMLLPWRSGKQHIAAKLAADEEGDLVLLSHGQTHYIIDGQDNTGPLVVLVHGFVGSTAYLRFLARELARRGRRVLRYDLYGRGLSVLPGRRIPHTVSIFSSQLAELLFALGSSYGANQQVDLVGYSMGGGIAAHFAATFPDRVRSVVFIAPAGMPSMRKSLPWYLPIVLRIPLLRAYMAEQLINDQKSSLKICGGDPIPLMNWDHEDALVIFDAGWRRTDSNRFSEYSEREHKRYADPASVDVLGRSILLTLGWFPWGELESTFRRVAENRVPALVVWGDDDQMVTFAGFEELKRVMPEAQYCSLRGARHMVVVEEEERVADVVFPFWQQKERRARHVSNNSADFDDWVQDERGF